MKGLGEQPGIESPEPSSGEMLGPYRVREFVARGGMASVLSADDDRTGDRVALKLLLAVAHDEEARTRFRREFRALSRLEHDNVLRVYEWGLRGNRPWYSMELITGQDLRAEVENWAQLNASERFSRVQGVLTQVTRALAYIHDRGLIHRDITPGNIMVRPDGLVKLMDFGVVKDMGTDLTAVGSMVGTVSYISPEQIEGENVDVRADLYSLGAVLYFMLTGQRPFTARTLQGFLDKHLNEKPKPPADVDPMVPPHLNEICLRLLEKDPNDRYASAAHLLHVLGDDSSGGRTNKRWPPHAVGRVPVRNKMREKLNALTTDDRGGAIYLAGEPGQGKTRLLSIAESYAQRFGLKVITARCRPEDRPFGAFTAVYREFADREKPSILRSTFDDTDSDQVRERYPIIAAARELIVENAPCVILIDDMENADPATIELLEYLIRNTLALANAPVVYMLAEETNLSTPTSLARRLCDAGPVDRFHLGPLSVNEVEELVLSILPHTQASKALSRRLHDEGSGSPAFIADTLLGLIDEGVITNQNERFSLELDPSEVTRSRLPIPVSLKEALQERLSPLSQPALTVGQCIALARRRLDLDVLVDFAPLEEDDIMEALDELVEADIVHEHRTDDLEQVGLSHKRFRDVLIDGLNDDEKRDHHQRLGELLERHYRQNLSEVVEQLTYHFEEARLASKAYAYLCQTAQRHINASSLEPALAFIERALRMEPEARAFMLLNEADERLAQTRRSRAQCLHHLGQWDASFKEIQHAYELAKLTPNIRLQSSIASEMGRHLRDRGDLKGARRFLTEALEKADQVGDVSLRPGPLYQLGAILWSDGDLEQCENIWLQSLNNATAANDERAKGFGYNGLGILAICKGKSMEARRHLEQSAQIFERVGLLAPLAIARVNLAELYHNTGILKKGLQLTEKTIAQSREVHHPHGLALGLAHRAHLIADIGRVAEATKNATESLRLSRELNAGEDELVVLVTLIRIYVRQNLLEKALECLEEVLPLLKVYDFEGAAPEVHAWHAYVLAGLGRLDEAQSILKAATDHPPQWPHIQVRTLLAQGQAHMKMNETKAASDVLSNALQMAESNGFRYYQLIAHHHLCGVIDDENARARHKRVAIALARSLAANLSASDSKIFLSRGWGS